MLVWVIVCSAESFVKCHELIYNVNKNVVGS